MEVEPARPRLLRRRRLARLRRTCSAARTSGGDGLPQGGTCSGGCPGKGPPCYRVHHHWHAADAQPPTLCVCLWCSSNTPPPLPYPLPPGCAVRRYAEFNAQPENHAPQRLDAMAAFNRLLEVRVGGSACRDEAHRDMFVCMRARARARVCARVRVPACKYLMPPLAGCCTAPAIPPPPCTTCRTATRLTPPPNYLHLPMPHAATRTAILPYRSALLALPHRLCTTSGTRWTRATT